MTATKFVFKVILPIAISLTILPGITCKAQTYQNIIRNSGISETYTVEQTTDGGYVILSSTPDIVGNHLDIFLIKTSSTGDTLWTRKYGGPQNDFGKSIRQTPDGGYIIAGNTLSFGAGTDNAYLLRTDSNGNLLWSKTYGGIFSSLFRSVELTNDGGYIAVGFTNDFGGNLFDFYIVKTDSSGNIVWTKTYGGAASDQAYSIQKINSGFLITGRTNGYGAGLFDIFLVKTDTTGNIFWAKSYGGSLDEHPYEVKQTFDGGFIIAGYSNSFGAGMSDVVLIKTDASGNVSWTKTYGGTNNDKGFSVQQTSDSGYVVTGYTQSFGTGLTDVYLIKTNNTGDIVFTKTFGSPTEDQGYSVLQANDGGYIIVGSTIGFGIPGIGIYFIKTDNTGSSGCNETTPTTVVTNVLLQADIQIPGVSAGGADSIAATITASGGFITPLCTSIGLNENYQLNNTTIFPNPSNGNINFTFARYIEKGEINIFDLLGKIVFSKFVYQTSTASFSLDDIEPGVYVVQVIAGSEQFISKFIIQ